MALVRQSEQALHHAVPELIAGGLESGKTIVWPDVVSFQATSSKSVNDNTISDKLAKPKKAGLVLAEAQVERATDDVGTG